MLALIFDYFDAKKRRKALTTYPYQYTDRHGRHWFNTSYRTGYGAWRKWC